MSANLAAVIRSLVESLPEVSASALLSSDGAVVARHPAASDGRSVEVWSRVGVLGGVRRGFLETEGDLVAFVRAGGRVALAVAARRARPEAVLDALEQAMERLEGLGGRAVGAEAVPRPPSHGERRRRPALHPSVPSRLDAQVASEPLPTLVPATARVADGAGDLVVLTREDDASHPGVVPGQVDPAELAREFGALLSDEGSW